MKKLIKTLLVLLFILSISSIYAQARPRVASRPHHHNPAKVVKHPRVIVKPAKRIKKGKWQKLGTKTVNLKVDFDQLIVTAYEGAFTKIKFKINGSPVHINSITIIFANGEDKHLEINENFPSGTISKVIDLPGNQRIIQKINFNYQTVNTDNGRGIVTVFGLH